jgi:exocyst complex component 7
MVVFIGLVISDDWIRMHNRKLQQQAMRYERASWNSVFCCLNDDGMCAASDAASRETIREKLKDFNMSFQEVCEFKQHGIS